MGRPFVSYLIYFIFIFYDFVKRSYMTFQFIPEYQFYKIRNPKNNTYYYISAVSCCPRFIRVLSGILKKVIIRIAYLWLTVKGGYMEHHNMPAQSPDGIPATNQLEDKVLKTAAMFFGHELLPYLGIKGDMTAIAPTEQVHLDIRRMEEDFNYRMEDGTIRHLEFESDGITDRDLRRFREYEAYLSLIFRCPVITTVLCSAVVRNPKTRLNCGINVYRIEVVRTKSSDADAVFSKLDEKLKRGQYLTRGDLFPIMLTPLMSGAMKVYQRICMGIDFLHMDQVMADKDDIRHMEAALYALAIKFLDKSELEKVKEKMRMTLLGQMLIEDGIEKGIKRGIEQGIEKGIEKGIEQGEMNKLISQVMKKRNKGMSPDEIAEDLEEDPAVVRQIYSTLMEYPDQDVDAVYQHLNQ